LAENLKARAPRSEISGGLSAITQTVANYIVGEDDRAYNEAIAHHPRVESLILPIVRHRVDGLAISIVR
jgi:hypothetical protein